MSLKRRGNREEQRVNTLHRGSCTERVRLTDGAYAIIARVLILLVEPQGVRLVSVFLAGWVMLLSRDNETCGASIFTSRTGEVPAAVRRARVEFYVGTPRVWYDKE